MSAQRRTTLGYFGKLVETASVTAALFATSIFCMSQDVPVETGLSDLQLAPTSRSSNGDTATAPETKPSVDVTPGIQKENDFDYSTLADIRKNFLLRTKYTKYYLGKETFELPILTEVYPIY